MRTRKTTFGTRTNLSTSMADFGSVIRFNSNNFYSLSFSFVLDEKLQLVETPITQNPIKFSAFSLFSYSFKIFHHYFVSVEIGNNTFTYIMVYPCHKPFFTTAKLFKESLSTSCAFGLKFRTQIPELSFDLFDFRGIIKPAIRTDGEVIYSEVNAQNSRLQATVQLRGINLFGECENEETSTFFVNHKQTFLNIPSKIFFITFWNSERNFNSAFDCSETQNIVLEGSRTWEIISHTYSFNYWFAFSSFNHTTCLFDTSDSELSLQTHIFKFFIDERMKFDIIFNLFIPSSINTELQSFRINFESFDYLWSCIDFNFSTDSCLHKDIKHLHIFKPFENRKEERAFLPRINAWVSCLIAS